VVCFIIVWASLVAGEEFVVQSNEAPNKAALERIYVAYNTGNVAALLADAADDVQIVWQSPAHAAFSGTWIGKKQLVEFVVAVLEELDCKDGIKHEFLTENEAAGKFFANARCAGPTIAKRTGNTIANLDIIHYWQFNNEHKLQRFVGNYKDPSTVAEAILTPARKAVLKFYNAIHSGDFDAAEANLDAHAVLESSSYELAQHGFPLHYKGAGFLKKLGKASSSLMHTTYRSPEITGEAQTAEGTVVSVIYRVSGTSKLKNNKQIDQLEFFHIFTVNAAGKIIRMRHLPGSDLSDLI